MNVDSFVSMLKEISMDARCRFGLNCFDSLCLTLFGNHALGNHTFVVVWADVRFMML